MKTLEQTRDMWSTLTDEAIEADGGGIVDEIDEAVRCVGQGGREYLEHVIAEIEGLIARIRKMRRPIRELLARLRALLARLYAMRR
jgi:hypothetical protein